MAVYRKILWLVTAALLVGLGFWLETVMPSQGWAQWDGKRWQVVAKSWAVLWRGWPLAVSGALVGFSGRYAELADALARREPDPTRRRELEQIAAACRHVPAHPARTFREALQSFWFIFLAINPSLTAAAGRFDQYMYPLYRQDVDAGRLMRDEAVELLACLRIKDMQLNRVSGALNRKKNAGLAKWHNWTLGGQTRDGRDASNELSYLLLDAALAMPVPHHTLTLRVHAGTPDDLMLKALEVVGPHPALPRAPAKAKP